MKTIILQSLMVGILVTFPCSAFEVHRVAGNPITWPSANPNLRAFEDDFPTGSGNLNRLTEAVDFWNDNPSNFRFNLLTGEPSVRLFNGQNEVWFSDSNFWVGSNPNVVGRTWWWHNVANMVEADILFRASTDWTTSNDQTRSIVYGGDEIPFTPVALHEMGHMLGLRHEDATYNMMGDSVRHVNVNNGIMHFYPGEDACNGAVSLYGLDSTHREDVAVTHWKWSGRVGDSSSHERTKLFEEDGVTEINVRDSSDDPQFTVFRGDTVQMEFTLENNGATTQSPRVAFYVSDNDNITTTDVLLDNTRQPTIGRNSVYTTTQTLTIPADLTRGKVYYLGVIVDYDNAITEVKENNNATYIAIYVR